MRQELARLHESVAQGGLYEAVIRALFHVLRARGEADERHFRHAWRLLQDHLGGVPPDMAQFRRIVRRQALLMQRRSEEHTSELQSPCNLVCRLLLEKKKKNI